MHVFLESQKIRTRKMDVWSLEPLSLGLVYLQKIQNDRGLVVWSVTISDSKKTCLFSENLLRKLSTFTKDTQSQRYAVWRVTNWQILQARLFSRSLLLLLNEFARND
jgi:hypothetical protein